MAFAVAAIALGGFTIYNLTGAGSELSNMDPAQRFQNIAGNKHAKINYSFLVSQHRPISDPRNHRATHTFHKRVKARTDSIHPNPNKRKNGTRDMAKYDYRRGSRYMAAPIRHLEAQWG